MDNIITKLQMAERLYESGNPQAACEALFGKRCGEPKLVEEAKVLLDVDERVTNEPVQKPFVSSGSSYELMEKNRTYACGVYALRKACKSAHPQYVRKDGSRIYRPLTFQENFRARLDDYNTLNYSNGSKRSETDRLRLFSTWLDSCTGIAYKAGSTKFKLVTISEDLICIHKDFYNYYLQVQYSQMQGVELDSSDGGYNQRLTLDDVINHSAWNEAVTDKPLLNEYANLVFRLKAENNMGFFVRQKTQEDELRALFVYDISNNSIANGLNLKDDVRFVRVTHVVPKAP